MKNGSAASADLSLLPPSFDLPALGRALDLSRPVMAGHSFGGVTTLLALRSDPRFKLGVSLDPWLFPLRDEDLREVPRPVMVVSTDSFRSRENLDKMRELKEGLPAEVYQRLFYYIKGSVHQNYLDAPFLFHVSRCPQCKKFMEQKLPGTHPFLLILFFSSICSRLPAHRSFFSAFAHEF